MNDIIIFTVELTTCLVISGAVIHTLNPLLRDLLAETCGTVKRARFWVRFTDLMLLIAPLLAVIFFSHTGEVDAPGSLLIFKDTLFRCLLGEFVGLAIIGQLIWKSIRLTQPIDKSDTDPQTVSPEH